jgi:hypothetical protein
MIRLIHWKTDEAEERAALLLDMGYAVDFSPINNVTLRALWSNPPSAIIIDLTRIPSQGRDLGVTIRKRKATRYVPLIFVGGKSDKVTRVKALLPDAFYTRWESIPDVISYALENPLENPIVPDSGMAAYSGTPLSQKLGIKKSSTVYLINAPEDFRTTLGELPAHVSLFTEPGSMCDLTLWFVRISEELHQDISRLLPKIGKDGLWIIWPKSSVKTTGLSQNVVRKVGMDAGLVDYKISSIDKTWSGLRFTQKIKK